MIINSQCARHIARVSYFLFLISLTVPLWYTSFTFFPAHYGKTVLFTALVEIILFCQILTGDINFFTIKNWWRSLNLLTVSVLILFGVLLVTSFFGADPANSFWGYQARGGGLFVWAHFVIWWFLSGFYLKDRSSILRVIGLTVVVGVLVAITAVWPAILPAAWQPARSSRLAGIFGNPAFLANYLVSILFLSALAACYALVKWQTIAWLTSGGFVALVLIRTNTRGAWLGVLAGILIALISRLVISRSTKKIYAWSLVAFIGGIITLAGLTQYSFVFNRAFPRLADLSKITKYNQGTGQTRLYAWGEALDAIRERPFTGWGLENYDVVYNKFYNPRFLKYSFAETVWDKPHNWLLEMAVAGGLGGALAYSAVLASALYFLWRGRGDNNPERVILAGALVAGTVANFFLFETTNTFILWWLLLSVIASRFGDKTLPATVSSGRSPTILVVGAFVFMSVSLYQWHYLPLKMSYYLSHAAAAVTAVEWSRSADLALGVHAPIRNETAVFLAERLVKLDQVNVPVTSPLVVASALNVASALESAAQIKSLNPTPLVWAGQLYMILGATVTSTYFDVAERDLLRAVVLSPQKQDILFLLGHLYILQKNFSKAVATQEVAIAAAPDIPHSYWFLGLTQIAAGNTNAGLGNIETAESLGYDLTLDQVLYVIDIYASVKKYDRIITRYQKLADRYPDNPDWLAKLAATYLAAGQKDLALATVRQAVERFPQIKNATTQFIKVNKLDQ